MPIIFVSSDRQFPLPMGLREENVCVPFFRLFLLSGDHRSSWVDKQRSPVRDINGQPVSAVLSTCVTFSLRRVSWVTWSVRIGRPEVRPT